MITTDKQQRIIDAIKQAAKGLAKRKVMLFGAALALEEDCPPYWTMNIMCGRVDRIFNESPKLQPAFDEIPKSLPKKKKFDQGHRMPISFSEE